MANSASEQSPVPPPARLFAERARLTVSESWVPTLTVVIDTEEEFDWSAPFDPLSRSVANIAEMPLAQSIFDRHSVVPAYVIDHPVVSSEAAVSVLREIEAEGRCEIGAHLHPWVNSPESEHRGNRFSYPGNLPRSMEFQKLKTLTDLITAQFSHSPIIYKAGRYGVGPATEEILCELGYKIDVSVVPFTDFSRGFGPDFSEFDTSPFLTHRGIIELPLTVGFAGSLWHVGRPAYALLNAMSAVRAPGIASRLGLLERIRLSPEGHTLEEMKRLTRALLARGERLFMMTCHSSSFLPGGSPYAPNAPARDALLERIAAYIEFFFETCHGRAMKVSSVASSLLSESDQRRD